LPVEARRGDAAGRENKQLVHRLPAKFIRKILKDFNSGSLDAASAANQLAVSRTRLYELRADYLQNRAGYQPNSSGGDRHGAWPDEVHDFLEEFLPLQNPPNYQLVTDELGRLCDFKRARSTVEAYIKSHFPELIPTPPRKPRVYRRFRRARIGELWQHDSSIHQWWPASRKQTLIMTVDDCSGLTVGGSFVESDTTWSHFLHFRSLFESHGIPEAAYTDALSLFGASSSYDHSDPKSEFQRVLLALGVAHLVAPTPQAKGKIERRFGTFQKRLVTLLAHAKATNWQHADEILQMEIARQNRTVNRSIGKIPLEIWDEQIISKAARLRPCPPTPLLDLHFSLRSTRRVNPDHTIDFDGRSYEISPTSRKTVSVIFHPLSKLWVVEHPPKRVWPPILGTFTL